MRLLYDVTVLGNAYRERWQRTGVFRVVDELARQLTRQPGCDLRFCSAVNPFVQPECLEYLKADSGLGKVPFSTNRLNQWAHANLDRMNRNQRRLGAGLRGFGAIMRTITAQTSAVAASDLRNADVFHSPAFHLPPELKSHPQIKAFLTIYDLIPVLLPHLCVDETPAFFEKGLTSLRPDGWVLCISESTKRDLCDYLSWLSPERVIVTPLAASATFYPCPRLSRQAEVRSRYGLPEGRYFLSLGTLEPRKNVEHTIRCFCRLVAESKLDDVSLVLVGEKGWKYDEIFKTAAEHKVAAGRIIFTGYVPDEDLAPLYTGALAFVFPSLYEGFGLPPLEAMQCGTAVVTSDNSSLPEVVGDAGIMVSATDEDALCQAMLHLYEQPELARRVARQCLERSRQFTWEHCGRLTMAAYETALATS